MAGHNENIVRDRSLDLAQRSQVKAEGIAVRIDGPHADIRRDLRKHLVGGEQQLSRFTVKHDLLGRVAFACHDGEAAPSDREHVAGDNPREGQGKRSDFPEVRVSFGVDLLHRLHVESVVQIELSVRSIGQVARTQGHVETAEVGSLSRQHRGTEFLAEPAGETDVIRVEMRDNDARDRPASERTRDQRLPGRTSVVVVEASVDDGPAVTIVDEVDVDVVQPEGKRDTGPENTGHDLSRSTDVRGRGKRIVKGRLCRSCCACHSHSKCRRTCTMRARETDVCALMISRDAGREGGGAFPPGRGWPLREERLPRRGPRPP